MHDIWMDVRIAMRRLRHSPGFVLVALLSLTMAIAANLVVFGVTNAAILRPLNVANADRLWMVVQKPAKYISQSYPDYLDYRARNTTFSDMAAYRFAEAGLSTQGIASKRWSYEVSANYFDMLGVQPELGRLFHANEERLVLALAVRRRSGSSGQDGRSEQASVHRDWSSAGRVPRNRVNAVAGLLDSDGERRTN
jgi:hypothetical protein